MGSSAMQQVGPEPTVQTRFGVAKVSITDVWMNRPVEAKNQSAYVTMKMTNQTYTSKPFSQPQFQRTNDFFDFIMNSRHQFNGRPLVVELWEKGVLSNKPVGIGMVDMNGLTEPQRKHHEVKVYLNQENQMVGWVKVECQFEEMKADPITIMFQSALIRRKTSRSMNCRVKTVIGEQTLSTRVSADREDKTPSWAGDHLTFYLINGVTKQGKIMLMDDDIEVGNLTLNLQEIIQSEQQQIEIKEEFYFEENIAGTVRLFINKGQNTKFQIGSIQKSIYVGTIEQRKNNKKLLASLNVKSNGKEEVATDKVERSELVRVGREKQGEIDKIKKEFQVKNMAIQEQKVALLAVERQNADKLRVQNEALKQRFEEEMIKIKEDLLKANNSQTVMRNQKEEEFLRIIKDLELRNEQLKKGEVFLNTELATIKASIESKLQAVPERQQKPILETPVTIEAQTPVQQAGTMQQPHTQPAVQE